MLVSIRIHPFYSSNTCLMGQLPGMNSIVYNFLLFNIMFFQSTPSEGKLTYRNILLCNVILRDNLIFFYLLIHLIIAFTANWVYEFLKCTLRSQFNKVLTNKPTFEHEC